MADKSKLIDLEGLKTFKENYDSETTTKISESIDVKISSSSEYEALEA